MNIRMRKIGEKLDNTTKNHSQGGPNDNYSISQVPWSTAGTLGSIPKSCTANCDFSACPRNDFHYKYSIFWLEPKLLQRCDQHCYIQSTDKFVLKLTVKISVTKSFCCPWLRTALLSECLLFSCYTQSYDMIYLLTAIGLTPGGSSTVHIYTQTIHRTTQLTTEKHN